MPLIQHDSVLLASEPIKKTWWTLDIEGPDGVWPFPKDLDWQVRSIPSLQNQVTQIQVTDVNSILNIPGQKSSTNGEFVFHLYSSDKILRWWRKWFRLVYGDDSGSIGLYSDVVGQAKVNLWVPGGDCSPPILNRTITLRDIWPTAITMDGMDREDDGSPLGYSVSLSIADVAFDEGNGR